MRLTSIRPEFMEFIPRELNEGVLYVSERYSTASHKCACGCGERVVTPLSPVDWQLQRDGNVVSLRPSIGNWRYACRSHYWIRRNQIRWAKQFTAEEISQVQQRDLADKARYIEQLNMQREANVHDGLDTKGGVPAPAGGWRRRLLRWLRRFWEPE
jgi:hypothetical protein